MLSKRLGSLAILLVLAITLLSASAQVSSGPVARQTAAVTRALRHKPMKFHSVRSDGTLESENWSGYAVTGSDFTKAGGSWTIAEVNCSATPNTYSAFWVGIDGYSSSTVEQTGTIAYCDGDRAVYYAWYEFYPAGSVEISSVPVSPGNKISASVTYSGEEFTTKITNESMGKSHSQTARVAGAKRSSAEWIAEAPCCTSSGDILPLSDFGTGDFGADYTGVSGTNDAAASSVSGAISKFGADVQKMIMVSSNGAEEALPSALTSDGTSFTVVWKSE
jgi:Peptidase A4 family